MNWTVETFSSAVDDEIAQLPADVQGRLKVLTGLIETAGPASLSSKVARHLEGKLWELRIMGRDGIVRIIYVTISGRRMILLRAFVKKTQKTPLSELDLARKRASALG